MVKNSWKYILALAFLSHVPVGLMLYDPQLTEGVGLIFVGISAVASVAVPALYGVKHGFDPLIIITSLVVRPVLVVVFSHSFSVGLILGWTLPHLALIAIANVVALSYFKKADDNEKEKTE